MQLAHDLRIVARGLLRSPGVTLLVVLTLGLAIGANSATFSLIDRVALRPLPVEKPEQLVMLTVHPLPHAGPGFMMGGGRMMGIDYPLFDTLRTALSPYFSATSLRRQWRATLSASPTSIEVPTEFVDAGYFRVLGLKALLGRTILPSDDGQKDGPAIAVLNHGFWMRQFGSDPGIIGRTIRLNNVPVTVAGVLAPGYDGMEAGWRPEIFVPLAMSDPLSMAHMPAGLRLAWNAPGVSMYVATARLRPGVERERAERELRSIYQRLLGDALGRVPVPQRDLKYFTAHQPELVPAGTVGSSGAGAAQKLEQPLRLLLGMTVFVLLVAAGNVANLLAARGARRRYEVAVSFALGASRWDILRPRLLECLALGGISGAAGLLFAAWTGSLIPVLLDIKNELAGVNTRPDLRVVAFTVAVSLAVGVCIWLASALAVTRRGQLSLSTSVVQGARAGRSGTALRHLLVVAQLALSLALVCASVLLGRSLWNALGAAPGFDADRLVSFTVSPGSVGYEGDRLTAYANALSERVQALPGVTRVALASAVPLSGGGSLSRVDGPRQRAASAEGPYVEVVDVSPEYFQTIGLPIRVGRGFDARDGKTAPRVAVVNEALAALLAGREPIVGSTVRFEGLPPDVEIVGVVRDARGRSLKANPEPTLFRPLAQAGAVGVFSVLLRADVPQGIPAAAVSDLVRRIDANVAMTKFGPVTALARAALFRERMLSGLSVVFAALSAVVAAIGLLGVASFNVTRRTREIGIRLALGASQGKVAWMVLREVAWLVTAGGCLGVGLFFAGNRVLASMLFQVSANDPWTIVVAAAGLALTALVAGVVPARRAAGVDPAVTLRCE